MKGDYAKNEAELLSKKEQQQIEKTIKAGRDARRRLKNYSKEIRAKRDKNLALLKKLKQRIKMTEKIELTYTSKEGRIGFQVNDVYYEYQLDTSYFPAVLKMNQSQPSKALNFVRKISPGMTKFRVNKLEIAIKALEEIRDTQGKVCQEFEICDCVGCKSSYAR